jgi:hypothetical protein
MYSDELLEKLEIRDLQALIDNEREKHADVNHLNHPEIIQNFTKHYLNSLNTYLDNDMFSKKMQNMPTMKSVTITKFEKLLERKGREKQSKLKPLIMNKHLGEIKEDQLITPGGNAKDDQGKIITQRYIIIEPENREIDLNNIEEVYEYRTKLLNPFRSFMIETNDKIKKQAIEQILKHVTGRDKKKNKNQSMNNTGIVNTGNGNNSHANSMINLNKENSMNSSHNSNFLQTKYNNNNQKGVLESVRLKENHDNFMKYFKDSCESHNIVTLDQKIDYYVYLKNNSMIQYRKETMQTKSPFMKIQTTVNGQSNFNSNNRRNKFGGESSSNNLSNSINNAGGNIIFGQNSNQNLYNQTQSTNHDKTPTVRDTFASSKSKSLNLDLYYKYMTDLKNKFKIVEDANQIKTWENYYNELQVKISAFKNQNRALDSGVSF